MPCRVGQEVVQDLDDTRPVGHDRGQVGRQVDDDGALSVAPQEHGSRVVHEVRQGGRRGCNREHAGLQASGVQQVADEHVHAISLVVDDAEELVHLGRFDDPRGTEHGGCGPLDGGQRRAQFVAHQVEEFGPRAFQLLDLRQILN